ncbi:Ig domain-containing protein [Marinilabiliaceae bacterium JC040]|nr:Ig domain-containing protein [Marinilabiliaceae bacterium JC040]
MASTVVSCSKSDDEKAAKVESITLASKTVSLTIGDTHTIKATILPADADKTLTYASTDEKVATVTPKGVITAVAAGKTTISVKAKGGVVATLDVTVGAATFAVGKWDGTMVYVMDETSYSNIDDWITFYSTPKKGETDEEKAKREKYFKMFTNVKKVYEEFYSIDLDKKLVNIGDQKVAITKFETLSGKGDSEVISLVYKNGDSIFDTKLVMMSETDAYIEFLTEKGDGYMKVLLKKL